MFFVVTVINLDDFIYIPGYMHALNFLLVQILIVCVVVLIEYPIIP